MLVRSTWIAAFAAGLALGCAEEQRPRWPAQDLVLVGVTVVDTRSGALAPNRAILVDDGRIAAIAPADSVYPGPSERVVDATGKFAVPGYLDMHAHPLQADPESSLALMLAHGVTGWRQMGGTPELLEQRRRGEPLAAVDAPELLLLPGLPLVTPLASTPEAVVEEVREQHASGADFIKVASLEPEPFFAALAEASRLGLPFAGHLPPSVDPREAARQGMHAIEHLGPSTSLLLACSTEEASLRERALAAPRRRLPSLPRFLRKLAVPLVGILLEKLIANPALQSDAEQLAFLERALDTYSEEKCAALARDLAGAGVWQVPTLIRLRTTELAGDPAYRGDPELRFMPRETRAFWASLADEFEAKFSAAQRSVFERAFARQLELVALFEREGVRMLAGSDLGGAQWIVPGRGLHQEFELLAQAGVAPLRVLQMTTLDGAAFLGRESTLGSIEAGKDANLVLLDRNPVERVQNLHAIAGVVRAGRYYDRAALDEMLARSLGR